MVAPVLLGVGALLWLFWLFCALYLLALAAGAAVYSLLRRPRNAPNPVDRIRRFAIIIPAHNEELLLGHVLDALREQDYPADSYETVVVADNCTDATADVARAHGATALERTNPDLRGKGFALDWAIRQLLAGTQHIDAFVILDADSFLSSNFLAEMNRALSHGREAIQGYYQVQNVEESWRTRLMACALALAHYVKPLGRMSLGLSDGLKGNGMCFSRAVLERAPWPGESITEDIDYTLTLVRAGIRIHFVPGAVVRAQMPTTGSQAASQRQRWEGGRYGLIRSAFADLARSIVTVRPTLADRAIELIIPPFAEMFLAPAACIAGGLVWLVAVPNSAVARPWLLGWSVVIALQAAYLVAGLVIARVPAKVAGSLLYAPFYIVWKLAIYAGMALRRGAGGWVRTERRSVENQV